MVKCTIFKDSYDPTPHYITIDSALDRIKSGKSIDRVNEIRNNIDKERQDGLKKSLPSVCFAGEFNGRKDDNLVKHSGFLILDFDSIEDVLTKKAELSKNDFIYSCWISPRNNGVKALVKIADGNKHREHFEALREVFPELDKSGSNPSRLCFESYDPDIYINNECSTFKKVHVHQRVEEPKSLTDESEIFKSIVKWLSNKGNAFISGERNHFIYKLASACCRFGLNETVCIVLCNANFAVGQDKFSVHECESAVKSAYKSSKNLFGSASFEKDILVDRISKTEVQFDESIFDHTIRAKDVIFGEDVKGEALDIYENGYQKVEGIGVFAIDNLFKCKEGETTLLSGYGNYGKSSFLGWKMLMRVLVFGEKFALFTPEEEAVEFYHNMVEMLLGCNCTPSSDCKPPKEVYERAYDFISKHIFYVYPKVLSPTPEYIKERFLELVIKEGVKGVVIDPFNQLDNDYNNKRTDKYLETFLADCSRFAKQNMIYFFIIAHPKANKKDASGNYPCPDVFDIADGAMWNNKMDNILIYDRPKHQTDPDSDVCELHSKKIRRQKIVGKKGKATFEYNRKKRRFIFSGYDPIDATVLKKNYDFYNKKHGVQTNIIDNLNTDPADDLPF
jgi:hypothetical protein